MPRSANQKLKMLYLKDILCKYTDEQHPLSAMKICEMLREYGVEAERKSIYDDMGMLAAYGMDIMKINGRDGGFFLGSRDFELAELKLLVDAVMSSKFITKRKSDQLIKKITALAGDYDSDELKRQLHNVNRIKGQNESILYIVDDINSAIRGNKKIEFRYCEWTPAIKLRPKKNGELYKVSPVTLIWDDEYYYMVAYDSDAAMVKHYRVDKIRDAVITEEAREKPADKIDMSAYSGKMFGMFGGKTVPVCFECPENKIGILIDRFGQDVRVTRGSDGKLMVHSEAVLSSQFYGWVASIGPDIRLASPSEAVNGMRQFLKANMDNY